MRSLKKEFLVIPALDVYKGGSVVRLKQGDFGQDRKIYGPGVLQIIQEYLTEGALRIHTIDLAGAEGGSPVNTELFKEIGQSIRSFEKKTGKEIIWQVGGGIRTEEDIERVINQYGAEKIILGGAAIDLEVRDGYLSRLLEKYGAEKFILDIAIGVSNNDTGKKVLKKNGWKDDVELSLEDTLVLLKNIGITETIVTSKDRDGMGQGPDLNLASRVKKYGFSIMASGGVYSVQDCINALHCGMDGVIVGKALLDKKFTFVEAERAIKKENQ